MADETNKKVKPRWTDLKEDGTLPTKVGDMFWIDGSGTNVKIVVACDRCGRGLLIPWVTRNPKVELFCSKCRAHKS